ncbi:MAG: carboxypeptidase regulatory-like domain-containing protein [Patescibacteria group bacterium]
MTLWLIIGDFVYVGFLLLLLKLTRPAYLAFRRRRSGYGVVFNSSTGLPEALVSVRLRDLHGQIVRTVVTDKHGRYKLSAPRGEYYVEATKPGFTFPSRYLGKDSATVYDNVLPAAHVIIKDYGVMTKNIPIDPTGSGARSWLPKRLVLGKNTQYTIAAVSPIIALAVAIGFRTSWFLWAVFLIYAIVLISRLFSFKPATPPYGTVSDAETKRLLPQVVVRLLDARFNKVLETQITSAKGRYAFVVSPGKYRILVKGKGYKTVILNYPSIKQEGTLLAKDLKLKQLTPKEAEEQSAEPEEELPPPSPTAPSAPMQLD